MSPLTEQEELQTPMAPAPPKKRVAAKKAAKKAPRKKKAAAKKSAKKTARKKGKPVSRVLGLISH
jgi:hypothetical protein